jgi:hypothetical protein
LIPPTIAARIMHYAGPGARPYPRELVDKLSRFAPKVVCDTAGRGAWATAREGWLSGIRSGADWVLVVHDDAVTFPDVARSIEIALADPPGDIISFFSTRPELLEARDAHDHWVAYDVYCWGLALALPRTVAIDFVQWCDANIREDWKADDTRLTLYACEHEDSIFCAAPSLFQHPPEGHGLGGTVTVNDSSPWYLPVPLDYYPDRVLCYPGDRDNFLLSRSKKFLPGSQWARAL